MTMSWGTLFEREAAVRDELEKSTLDSGMLDGEKLRTWWKSVEDLLKAYAIGVARGEQLEPPPVELARALSGLAGYLAIGQIPGLIEHAKTEGRRPPGPAELHDIGWAVAYRRACDPEGIIHNGQTIRIADKAPTKTLAEWFGVDANTIRGWVRDYPMAFLGVNDVDADLIESRAQKAGQRYSLAGRSHKAIETRSRNG